MKDAPLFDLASRRAAKPVDQRTVIDNLADGVASLDAQIRSMPFRVLREENILAAERTLTLLRGLLSELRAHVTAKGSA